MHINIQSAFIARSRRFKAILKRYLRWVFARLGVPIECVNVKMRELTHEQKLVTSCRVHVQLKTGNSVVIEQQHLRASVAVIKAVRAAREALEVLFAQLNLGRNSQRQLLAAQDASHTTLRLKGVTHVLAINP
jgi:hypothetical protein